MRWGIYRGTRVSVGGPPDRLPSGGGAGGVALRGARECRENREATPLVDEGDG